MIQNGDIPISPERMIKNARLDLGFPQFSGIEVPKVSAVITSPVTPSPAAGYSITPQEHMKYHEIFLSFDHDKDGYLTYDEAMAVLGKSKVDNHALQTIWYSS